MLKNKIAIHRNDKYSSHYTSWIQPWIDYCQNKGLDYDVVDCYQNNIIEDLKTYDYLLWNINNYVLQDMLFARTILNTAMKMGLKVFPDFKTSWHFDDKIAEYYLLQAVDAPIPKSWVFYNKEEGTQWLKNEAQYPLVAKLRCGSGSNNVKMLQTPAQAITYTEKMFKKGYKNVPGIYFKTRSNIKSTKNWKEFAQRFKRIPDFIQTISHSKMLPGERGYVYFQEYVPTDGYDLKIVVIGDKLSFIGRNVRKGDFRASGGGELFFNKDLVIPEIINTAFSISDGLDFQCMGYDFVVDKETKRAKILEMSYGFSYTALLQAGGYLDREGIWQDEPLNAPEEIAINLLYS